MKYYICCLTVEYHYHSSKCIWGEVGHTWEKWDTLGRSGTVCPSLSQQHSTNIKVLAKYIILQIFRNSCIVAELYSCIVSGVLIG